MRSGYRPGQIDVTWDDPGLLSANSRFVITGVNLYRSFDSEFGPYQRVTQFPIGSTYWCDRTDNELVVDEDMLEWVLFGVNSASGIDAPRYVFRTQRWPIVKEGSQATPADSPTDVQVFVDGVQVPLLSVKGATGEIEIDIRRFYETGTQTYLPTQVPTETSKVTCTYRYTRQLVRTDLQQRVFYRVTTVGIPVDQDLSVAQSQDLVETPLEHATFTSTFEIEKLNYMWREGVRRNRWILEQGGERVKVFLRKNVGLPCPCVPDEYHKQPRNDCPICYGTAIVGGYEGPYEILIAPDDAERRIAQKDIGRTVEHTYEVWTGPSPLLSMRDFIVKINNERYSIGAVRMPTNRGMLLQQHFNIGHLDEKDIRYSVPIDNPVRYPAVQFAPSGPEGAAVAEVTDKPNIPEERQLRGRTRAWENTEY